MLEAAKAGEKFLREMAEQHRAKRGTTDPSKPKPSE